MPLFFFQRSLKQVRCGCSDIRWNIRNPIIFGGILSKQKCQVFAARAWKIRFFFFGGGGEVTRKILRTLWDEGPRKGECNMNESIFKKIWNYSITVGQMIMTAIAMAIVTVIVWLLCRAFRPSKD